MTVFNLFPAREGSDPPAFPALTARNLPHYEDEAVSLWRQVLDTIGDTRTTEATRRAAWHRIVEDGKAHLSALTSSLVSGAIRLGSWFRGFVGDVVPRHVAVAGQGQPMPASLFLPIADWINRQVGFLERWKRQLLDATAPLTEAAIARARQYAAAVWATGANVDRYRQGMMGKREERLVLGVADHCTTHGDTPGCLEDAALGWRPIGTLRPIGSRVCRMSCRCSWSFR